MTVVLADDVTTSTLNSVRRASLESVKPEMRTILVANEITEAQLMNAIQNRVVSFLPRRQSEMRHILSAALNVRAGRAHLPAAWIRGVIENLRSAQSAEFERSSFSKRELDIVLLLAEGWTTVEIADKLSYSERTIKNCLHGMLTRLDLRSRAHAVGYAARLGVI
ncbi:response regulator transcription factor [Streptomyces sp. NPDC026673]|uniref:helix-turn-helix transcriptional regulator n=1 Tax=Streptomyces sp. NPDC026673 TaxID=3155724 RepID=UPI0033DC4B0D